MLAPRKTESEGDPLLVLKFWLIVSGIFIWEFFTNLDYEWNVIRGRQRYRWSIWIYSITRLSCLTVVMLALINFSVKSEINCQAWVTIGWIVSALGGYGLSSILIMLRIFAIWDRNKVVLGISAVIWLINFGFQLAGIVKIRAVWVPAASSCTFTNIETCKAYYINLLANDVILLLIMLVGLIRLRLRARAFLDLARILWRQGLIWLIIATAAELPQVLLLYLNLSDSLNFLFLLPAMITIVIAATRTYRALSIYATTPSNAGEPSGPSGTDSATLAKSNRLVSSSTKNSAAVVNIPPNRLEVTVHKAYDEYPMSNISRYPSSEAQADKPPQDLVLEVNAEGRDDSEEK